ncbi:MAG: carbon-phosphorus lyase complex subunit PhnI, partial [Rhizobiaceae bacterium]|nr:carbon-phosphorus lyase complex subunit PhnI [Rhizobiaceae bacterium]
AQGDVVEAVFLLRAFRTTLPRIGIAEPIDTAAMNIERRISAAFKDLPGGQVLGPTYDYTHRLLDFDLMETDAPAPQAEIANQPLDASMPRVTDIVGQEDFMEHEIPVREGEPVYDLTRQPMAFPANRDQRLQNLTRGDEGFLTALAYSTMRGYGGSHPYVGEIRMGEVPVEFVPEELGFAIEIGDIVVSECQMINHFGGSKTEAARFTRGYGLALGKSERKAMAMSLVDRALRCRELGEMAQYPAQDEEFVLYHTDNVEAAGFVSHLKLPHYVDFQGDLQLLRGLRAEFEARQTKEAAE